VGLPVEDAMALLNDREADRLREVALAGTGSAEEEPVLPLGDEATGGKPKTASPSRAKATPRVIWTRSRRDSSSGGP
jgi:hypothetical protein